MRPDTIERRVESWVREMAQRGDVERLPSLRELSVRFSVSIPRLSRLFHRLRDQGILDMAKKKGITIRRPTAIPLAAPRTSAVDRIHRRIKNRIAHGVYPAGGPLPKLSLIAEELSAGQATVLRAYRRLVREGVVARVGRGYRVGVPHDGLRGAEAGSDRCILIVQCRPHAFPDLLRNNWTRDFAFSFLRDMSRQGIQPLPVLASPDSGAEKRSGIPCGREGIARTMHELRARCIGMLVIGIAWDYEHVALEPFDDLLGWLCSFGTPVVWFDQMDAGGYYQNEHGVRESLRKALRKEAVRRRFVRCRFDERKAVELALGVARDRGHEKLAVIALSSPSPQHWSWVDQRCGCLAETAEKKFGGLDLRIIHAALDGNASPCEFRDEILAAGPAVVSEVERHMGRSTTLQGLSYPVRNLIELSRARESVADPSIDCFIALNDQMARAFRRWGESADCEAAREKPLLSFDDRPEILYPYRVSSINFGFDVLGTTAFRAFTRSGPPLPTGSRTLSAIPRINHLHSV